MDDFEKSASPEAKLHFLGDRRVVGARDAVMVVAFLMTANIAVQPLFHSV